MAVFLTLISWIGTTGILMVVFFAIHQWIEDNWVNSFEGAIVNGLIGILTTLMFPFAIGIVVADFVSKALM